MCVKWGSLYGPEYVNNLYAMVKRNITPPFRFVCLTDDDSGIHPNIETKMLEDESLIGWWTKIEYFKNPLFDINGPILAIDLDVVIVDNIDCFFEYHFGEFCMKQDIPGHGYSSCVMRFNAGEYEHVYDRLDLSTIDYAKSNEIPGFKKHKFWGDQIWITEQMAQDPKNRGVITWPEEWIPLFSIHCHYAPGTKKTYAELSSSQWRNGDFFVPPNAKILAFAGITGNNKNYLNDIKKWWHSEDIEVS